MKNNIEIASFVELTNLEKREIQGGTFVGWICGFVGAAMEYAANHEAKIGLPGGQAMKQ
jgi:hypothetical protein